MTGYDPVFEPEHYKAMGAECPNCSHVLEPILFTKLLNFCLGNVVKYVLRADHKGKALEDLRKARNYLDIEIAHREISAAREHDPMLEAFGRWARTVHLGTLMNAEA